MSLGGLGGGGSNETQESGSHTNEDGKEVIDGYEVADSEDMEWLSGIL